MTPVNGDFDLMLRDALHAEVDSLEPAAGGLERIRQRTRAPWLLRQASLMLTECVDLARLIGIRLELRLTSARAAVAGRGGTRAAFVGLLSSTVAVLAGLFTPPRRRGAAHRSGGGSTLGWLRPVLAVTGAVVIVVAGVYGLAQVRDRIVLELFRGGSSVPASPGSGAGTGHEVPTLNGQSNPAIAPSGAGTTSTTPSAKPTCSPTPGQQANPTPTPSITPTPTTTPTTSPTPTPTDSTTPAPSTSAASSEVSANTVSTRTVVTKATPATDCAGPSSSSHASSTATG
ncbi:MAG TPA: hypothetical protein VGQ26_10250 [Streptosporangiaceae bacterium]|jgi:hypothetical protein|nr:hypothetical protein [Streptosporangiaceae bacterium]